MPADARSAGLSPIIDRKETAVNEKPHKKQRKCGDRPPIGQRGEIVKENTTYAKNPFSNSAECAIISMVETPILMIQEGKSYGACYDEGNVQEGV